MARPKNKDNVWLLDKFYGGIADGTKSGYAGSFRFGQGLDYSTDPDLLTGLRKFAKDSGSTVVDAVKWIVTEGTNTWFYGDTGHIYKRTDAGVWSDEHTVSDSHGNGMAIFDDYLYYAGDIQLGRYGPLSGTPVWDDDFLLGVSEVDSSVLTSGQTYTAPTSVSETAANKIAWVTGGDYITGILVLIAAKGTGNWSIILHDSSNNELGRVQYTNATLRAGWFKFTFSNPAKVTSGETYHFHVISSVADGTVTTGTNADFSTACYSVHKLSSVEDIDVSTTVDLDSTTVYQVYTIPTAISELSTGKKTFIPDKHSITSISIQTGIVAGSNTYTLTLHDANDNSLGSVTKTTYTMPYAGFNRFDFTTPITVIPGATYHFHVTVSAGSANIFSTTASDMSTIGYRIHYPILENDEDFHPMVFFPNASALVIGNGNFIASYDGIAYRTSGPRDGSERVKLSKEEKIRCLDLVGDYLAAGTWKGNDVDDHGKSNLYLWDGTSSFVNSFKSIVGEINAIKTGDDGLLYVWHGGFGHLSIYDGSLTLVKTIPNVGENKFVEIFPGAVTTYNGVIRFGISAGDSTGVTRGIYSYGKRNKDYPRSLNFDGTISAGDSDNGVQVTSILGVGPSKYFVGWKNDSTYGVDKLSTTDDQATVYVESVIFDADTPYFEKKSKSVKIMYLPLTSGQSIVVKYKLDRASSWTTLMTASTVGSIVKSNPLDKRWKEIELRIELVTTGASSPSLIACALFFDYVQDIQE